MLKRTFWVAYLLTVAISSTANAKATEQQTNQNVVSLAPHLTEAMFWLGAGDRLSGRDRYSNYPPKALNIPVVGDSYTLSIEALLAAKPSLILIWQAPKALLAQLQQYNLEVFDTNPKSVDEIRQELQRLAARLDIDASEAMRRLDKQIAQLKSPVLIPPQKKALVLVQSQPPVVLGMGDSLASSLHYCGWKNAFEAPQAVINVTPEYLPTGDYQAVIQLVQGRNPYLKPVLTLKPNADMLVRPGPRFPAAMLQLCEQLNQP